MKNYRCPIDPKLQKVISVIVTYGRRSRFVIRTVEGALTAGAHHLIVIDNGSHDDVAAALARYVNEGRATVIRNATNLGSAGGYRQGLEAALDLEADFILLLDDDNLVGPDYIARLQAARAQCEDAELCAVIGYRRNHGGGTVDLMDRGVSLHESNAFLGFHIRDVPHKLRKRFFGLPPRAEVRRDMYVVRKAPYGGLMLPKSLCKSIGLPDPRFVLYEDDIEYTSRIHRQGGRILIVRDAVIEDIDTSWAAVSGPRSALLVWLMGGPDFRVFYTLRNHAYLDRRTRVTSATAFWMNVSVYGVLLLSLAIATGRFNRARLLLRAMWCGLMGKLGQDAVHRLP